MNFAYWTGLAFLIAGVYTDAADGDKIQMYMCYGFVGFFFCASLIIDEIRKLKK